jgi:hypothetical protein
VIGLEINPGDVLFVWGSGFVNREIEQVTHGPSHCAIFKEPSIVIEAQGGRVVGETALSFYLDGITRCEVWGDPNATDEQRKRMVDYAKTLYGTPYDYLLIPLELAHYELGISLNWYHENKHFICSSLVYDIAEHVGLTWASSVVCAPEGLIDFGTLKKKFDLELPAIQAVS